MRTTLTLDDDLAVALEAEARRQQKPFKVVVNAALRRGLRRDPSRDDTPYEPPVHETKLMPGVDAGALNRLADELETEAWVAART